MSGQFVSTVLPSASSDAAISFSTLFFAPAQAQKRIAELGGEALRQRLLEAWQAFLGRATDPAAPWLQVQQHSGPQAVQSAYAQVLAGRGDPRTGHVMALR